MSIQNTVGHTKIRSRESPSLILATVEDRPREHWR